MDGFESAVGWTGDMITWLWAVWVIVGSVAGGMLLARDELRFGRARVRAEDVEARASALIGARGPDAFRINGAAMSKLREAKSFEAYRFLGEVSSRIASRLAEEPGFGCGPSLLSSTTGRSSIG